MASIETISDEVIGTRRYLLFLAGGQRCACVLETVREIVPARLGTRLPGAPAWVFGLINLRGTLLTVVTLATRFGVAAGAGRSIVVLEGAGKALGVVVDEVQDVTGIAEDRLEPVDAARASEGLVTGIARLDDGVALVVDAAALVREALATVDRD